MCSLRTSLNARAATRAVPRQAPTPRSGRRGVRRRAGGRGTGRGRTRAGAASLGPPTPRHTCCSCPSSRCRSPSSGRARCRRTRPHAARAGRARQGVASPRLGLPLPAGWVHRHQLAARTSDTGILHCVWQSACQQASLRCSWRRRATAPGHCGNASSKAATSRMQAWESLQHGSHSSAPRQLSAASRPRRRWRGC